MENFQHFKTIKYLDVTLDSRLIFRHHLQTVKQKAVCRILSIRKFLRSSNLSLHSKLILYKALIRPIITYASPAWCTIPQSQFSTLEPIQNRALRFITNSPAIYTFPLSETAPDPSNHYKSTSYHSTNPFTKNYPSTRT